MMEDFRFARLSAKHKKWFAIHQVSLFGSILALTYTGIKVTNPQIVTTSDQMSLTIGAIVGLLVGVMAYSNRLKGLLKIKFIGFGVLWVLLYSLQAIMPTLIWTIGMVLVPLMVDDLILLPIWKNVWYNQYER